MMGGFYHVWRILADEENVKSGSHLIGLPGENYPGVLIIS
jgi:hypothetical protein